MPDQNQRQRETAYFLWQEAGRPDGMDLDFWIAAQQRKAAADPGRDDQNADVGRDDVSPRAPSASETGAPIAKKKTAGKKKNQRKQ